MDDIPEAADFVRRIGLRGAVCDESGATLVEYGIIVMFITALRSTVMLVKGGGIEALSLRVADATCGACD